MKRLFLTIGLVAAGSFAYGQGTVAFSNGGLTRLSTAKSSDLATATPGTVTTGPTTPGTLEFGLFYGIGESTSLTLLTSQFGVNSSTSAGVIASPADSTTALTLVSIPGAPGGTTGVYIQIDAWAAKFGTDYVAAHNAFMAYDTTSFWGQTRIAANVGGTSGLGASSGPGTPIWTTSSGTNPQDVAAITILQPTVVPEPASFALAGLSAAALLIFRRRK